MASQGEAEARVRKRPACQSPESHLGDESACVRVLSSLKNCALCGHDDLRLPSALRTRRPYVSGRQLNLRHLTDTAHVRIATRHAGIAPAVAECLVCTECSGRHSPMWVERGSKRQRILHTLPSSLDVVFVSSEFAVELQLLRMFEKLWVKDGVHFTSFAHAY